MPGPAAGFDTGSVFTSKDGEYLQEDRESRPVHGVHRTD